MTAPWNVSSRRTVIPQRASKISEVVGGPSSSAGASSSEKLVFARDYCNGLVLLNESKEQANAGPAENQDANKISKADLG